MALISFFRISTSQLPWVPEAFQARFPVPVKSSPLFVVREKKPVSHNRHLATTYLSVCNQVFNDAYDFYLYFSTRIYTFMLHKFILVFLDFRLLFLVHVYLGIFTFWFLHWHNDRTTLWKISWISFEKSAYSKSAVIMRKLIGGFHMTSSKFKLRNYRYFWISSFMRYYSTWIPIFTTNFRFQGFFVLR